VLSFTNVRIGDAVAPDAEIERFRAEAELAPLLKGEMRIVQMTVERPRFRVYIGGLAGDQPAISADAWHIDPEQVSLARVEIVDGSMLVTDRPTGRSWDVSDVDAIVEADSLRGPGSVEAEFIVGSEPALVRAVFGRVGADNSVTANLTVSAPNYPVSILADGILDWASGALRYRGTATLEGVPPQPDAEEPRSPWADFRATGAFELSRAAFTVNSAQVSYGATERPLILEGSGRIDLAQPSFDVAVKARQIDIDRTLGGGAQRQVSVADAFGAFLEALPRLPRPPIPGELHLDAQGVVVGGSVVQAVSLDLATAPAGWRIEDAAALLPGETRLDFNGLLSIADLLAFKGHARVASERPPALAAWWRGAVGMAGALDSFAVESDLDLGVESLKLSNLAATTGEGTVTGSVELRQFQQSRQLFANVVLEADRADLIKTRALVELLGGNAMLRGQIDHMTLSLRADTLSAGDIEALSFVLDGGLENGELQLRQLSVADLAGASITANGTILDPLGTPSGTLEAKVDADDITGAANYLARVLPESPAIARLTRVAPILSPFNADISAAVAPGGGEHLFALSGSFADTHVELTAIGEGSLHNLDGLSGSVAFHVDGEDSATVLTQLGLEPLPVEAGPLVIDAEFEGMLASGAGLTLHGTIAGINFEYEAETVVGEDTVAVIGPLKVESADTNPALFLAGLAAPGLGEGHPASASGQLEITGDTITLSLEEGSFGGQALGGLLEAELGGGVAISGMLDIEAVSLPALVGFATAGVSGLAADGWSDTALAVAAPPGLALDLTINAKALDLGLRNPAASAAMEFKLSSSELNIGVEKAEFAGGTLFGSIDAKLSDGEADVAVRGALRGGQLHAVVWQRNDLPIASGRLDVSFEAATRGRSMAGLVSALSGSGSFAISEGRIDTFNPQALVAVMQLAEAEEAPEKELARETFARSIGSDALSFEAVDASFAISNGVLDVTTVPVSAEDTDIRADAAIDLNTLTLESNWTVRVAEDGAADESQVYVPMRFSGPLAGPSREFNLNPLLNLLNARYEQRQREQVEALEEQRRQEIEGENLAQEVEERLRQRVAPPAEPAAPSGQPTPSQQPVPGIGPPLILVPPQGAGAEASDADLVERIGPAVEDIVTGTSR
jgi:hypothetical protein